MTDRGKPHKRELHMKSSVSIGTRAPARECPSHRQPRFSWLSSYGRGIPLRVPWPHQRHPIGLALTLMGLAPVMSFLLLFELDIYFP